MPPFDQRAAAVLQEACGLIFTDCPEVRSVAAVLDYHGQLNDANVIKGVWLDRGGQTPTAPDAICGSLFQMLRLVDDAFNRLIDTVAFFRLGAQTAVAEQQKVRKELEDTEQALQERLQALEERERAVAAREQALQARGDAAPESGTLG